MVFPAKHLKSWIAEQESAPWRENRLYFRDRWDALAIEQSGGAGVVDKKMMDESVKEV